MSLNLKDENVRSQINQQGDAYIAQIVMGQNQLRKAVFLNWLKLATSFIVGSHQADNMRVGSFINPFAQLIGLNVNRAETVERYVNGDQWTAYAKAFTNTNTPMFVGTATMPGEMRAVAEAQWDLLRRILYALGHRQTARSTSPTY